MHITKGIIPNVQVQLNLVYRWGIKEQGQIEHSITCNLMRNNYGTTTANPNAYFNHWLINFTKGFKADILFVQSLKKS
jgi:hypothetical protein